VVLSVDNTKLWIHGLPQNRTAQEIQASKFHQLSTTFNETFIIQLVELDFMNQF
jgi:hypothetical protein